MVLHLSAERFDADEPVFTWACALHSGTYSAETEEMGARVTHDYECWSLTTLGGETVNLMAEMVLDLDCPDNAVWWMGSHPVLLERTPIFLPDEPLKMLFCTHTDGPDMTRLADCCIDYRTLIRPSDFVQPIILACTYRPPGLPF